MLEVVGVGARWERTRASPTLAHVVGWGEWSWVAAAVVVAVWSVVVVVVVVVVCVCVCVVVVVGGWGGGSNEREPWVPGIARSVSRGSPESAEA